ncbi:uncharacterized protein FFE2_16091 [Fusarium fujikuroi]|nr:uncharacterized protein FFE2_16091 [Fusarium fujikuroi]
MPCLTIVKLNYIC